MEWKPTLQGLNDPSIKTFWWVFVKIWTSRKHTTEKAIFEGVLDFNLQFRPLAWTQEPDAMECHGMSFSSFLENYTTEKAIFKGVLDFNLQLHPLAWT